MARIEARSPGTGGHALKVIRASGRRPEPPPSSPPIPHGHCSTPSYSFGEDADVIELRPGPFSLTVEAERPFPFPSAFTPASVFEIHADVTVRGGRCYAPVMTCEGEATNITTCHLTLKQKSCAPLPSPRRIVLETIIACQRRETAGVEGANPGGFYDEDHDAGQHAAADVVARHIGLVDPRGPLGHASVAPQ